MPGQQVERQGDELGHLSCGLPQLGAGAPTAHGEPLDQRVGHGALGVEAAQRVLEDVLGGAAAAERPQRTPAQPAHLAPVDRDRASVRPHQPEHGAGERGLPRAGLADQPDDLPRRHREVDAVQDLGTPATAPERDVQPGDVEQRGHRRLPCSRTRSIPKRSWLAISSRVYG